MASEGNITAIFARQHGLITRAQVFRIGRGDHFIRHRLDSGRWQRVHDAVYRLAGFPEDFEQRLLAACLAAGPEAVASHRSAGMLWGLPILQPVVEVTIPHAKRVSIRGTVVHRTTTLRRKDTRHFRRIPVTSAARTVRDLASVLDASELEAVLDHSLAERILSAQALSRLASEPTRGQRGAGRLARLVADRPAGVITAESRFEMRLLRVLLDLGLPEPRSQFRIRITGGRSARVDFAYPEARLAIEADSYRHHSSRSAWSKDRVRNNELVALGWRVLPITYRDLVSDPKRVADQIARSLGARSHELGNLATP